MSILYLQKKNSDLICHCECEESLVGDPGQLDCPWCGCGWLFSCTKCRKAFSFAIAVEVDKTWEELAKEDLYGYSKKEPTEQDVSEWIEFMQGMLEHVELGQDYIYLDGYFIPANEEDFEAEGWHSKHDFRKTPQIIALKEDPEIINQVLSNREYWDENKI